MKFHKMHGAGNDYIYVDARKGREVIENPSELSKLISDRHFGVGSDGLVLIMDSDIADFRMRMFNADGSEAGMCGNASRCVGKYLYELGITSEEQITLETKSGVKHLKLIQTDMRVDRVAVDMDEPRLTAADIPMLGDQTLRIPIKTKYGEFVATCVSMGNPHAVIFVDDVENYPVAEVGRAIETHCLFPEYTNVEFVEVVSKSVLRMRVWERGSGETLACGTGACATLVAAHLEGVCERKATIQLLGGEVEVQWQKSTNRVILTGGAEWVFEGEYYVNN